MLMFLYTKELNILVDGLFLIIIIHEIFYIYNYWLLTLARLFSHENKIY